MRTLTVSEVDEVSGGRVRELLLVWGVLVSTAMDATDKAIELWEGVNQGYKDGDAGD